mmetsp:Transcript_15237/g.31415  ORF Transcript_15237/g.31415 Transcript_15237/m.31415 type:complete len:260 (+) Transcript_15237:69-848(+)
MGDFRGHFVPGSFFIGFSLTYLFVILRRVCISASLRQYIPERNERILKIGGFSVMGATIVGFFMEMIGGILYSTGPFHQLLHECLYLSYFLVALTAVIESNSRLPLDTWRFALSVALLLEGLLFNAHANMQEGSEKIQHQLMSLTAATNGFVCLYSTLHRSSIPFYVSTFSLMLIQGLWFYVIAFTYKGLVLTMHTVTPVYGIVVMGVMAGTMGASAWGREKDTDSSLERQVFKEYKKVSQSAGGSLSQAEVIQEDGII